MKLAAAAAAAAAITILGWLALRADAISQPDGELVRRPPLQTDYPTPRSLRAYGLPGSSAYSLSAVSEYDIEGRVLAKASYRAGEDLLSEASPIDLTLGWQAMSDTRNVRHVSMRLQKRFVAWWRDKDGPEVATIYLTSSNNHIIPSNPTVRQQLESVRIGDIVRLRGSLVDVTTPDGRLATTSRTREDTGKGACEIILVEEAQIRPRPQHGMLSITGGAATASAGNPVRASTAR